LSSSPTLPKISTQTVKTDIWERTGLTPAEMPEQVLDSGIKAALTEFSKHRTRKLFGQLNIIMNQTEYPFPTIALAQWTGLGIPDNVSDISDFYYAPETILGNLSFEETILTSIQGNIINLDFGGNIFDNPSLVYIWFEKLREFRDTIGIPPWRVIDGNPKILQLQQTPNENGVSYWEGKATWLIGDILPEDFEAFTKCSLWKAAEARAMKLAVAKEYREGTGIMAQPAFEFWQTKAKEFKADFLADVGHGRGLFSIG
jgi:hypothetical protein